jgi:hypothetical protein
MDRRQARLASSPRLTGMRRRDLHNGSPPSTRSVCSQSVGPLARDSSVM